MKEFWDTTLVGPLATLGARIGNFLPNLLAAILILTVGWLFAWILGRGAERLLRTLGADRLAETARVNAAITRLGAKQPISHLAGRVLYWALVLLVVVASLSALDVAPINQLAISFLDFIPRIVSATLLAFAGLLFGNFVFRAALIAAVNANFRMATTAAKLARWGVLLVTFAMALEQLGIARNVVVVGFGITLGGIVLAAAIAFGLGARDLAKDFLERKMSDRARDGAFDDLRHL